MSERFDWDHMWASEDGDFVVVARGACAWPIPVKRPPDDKKESGASPPPAPNQPAKVE